MRPQTPDWWLDELAHAGGEHLDAGYVAGYDRKAGTDPTADLELLRDHGLDETSTLIDLGAGTGGLALAAARACRRVVAVDVSPAMLSALRARAEEMRLANVECVRAGFLTYAHRGDPADFVYSRNALHHLPDFWKGIALRRVASMLRPNGVRPARGGLDASRAGDARARRAQHVRLAAEADAPAGGLRDPRGEPQRVAHVRRVHVHKEVGAGRLPGSAFPYLSNANRRRTGVVGTETPRTASWSVRVMTAPAPPSGSGSGAPGTRHGRRGRPRTR